MNDPLFVRRLEGLGNLCRDPEAFAQGNRPARDCLREIFAIHQLDDESRDAVAVFEAVDRRNMGMIQRGEHVRFPLKAGEPLRTLHTSGSSTLIATSRPSRVSRARKTAPMPPSPSSDWTSKTPNRDSVDRGGDK